VGNSGRGLAGFDPAADQVGDVEVVLDVFDGAVVRQLLEYLSDLLLDGRHSE
jgi:hypothetical protein